MKIENNNNLSNIMGTMVLDQASRLLDFNQPNIDVQLLDNVVNAMYQGQGAEVSIDDIKSI